MLLIPDRLLTRLRWNPFFAYVGERIGKFLAFETPSQ